MQGSTILHKGIITTASYLIIFIFIYTSINKIIELDKFISSIQEALIFPVSWARHIAYLTILAEVTISIALLNTQYRKIGFLLAAALLILFSAYILLMMEFSPFLPCSCGGVISMLSWGEHLCFNLILVIISLYAFKTDK